LIYRNLFIILVKDEFNNLIEKSMIDHQNCRLIGNDELMIEIKNGVKSQMDKMAIT